MTFYEAAVDVLRRSGRPLHFKKIAEMAVRDDLLSHVGKTPAETMGQRLDQEAERSEDNSWIVKTRPGVFGLREDIAEKLEKEPAKENKKPKRKNQRPKKVEEVVKEELGEPTLKGRRFDTMSDAAIAVLETRKDKSMDVQDVARIIFNQKLVRYHTHDPEVAVETAMILDNITSESVGQPPRFVDEGDGRFLLGASRISRKTQQYIHKIEDLIGEIEKDTVRQFSDLLPTLDPTAVETMFVTLLEAMGYANLKVAKRTAEGDVVISADFKGGFCPRRTCFCLVADAESTLNASKVKDLGATLGHYTADEGVVLHLGPVDKGANKAAKDHDGELRIIDLKWFVGMLLQHGIGARHFQFPIQLVDATLFRALKK